ncbi:hypothetical protein GIB67_022412 [Kingdonia uniflora]|uniref:DC-UbP/UBTD2 N-terminal domain-containing protein n=1 Tax=Kingdonia uniflora TaxID=39325 RepID=A0A7J7MU48_9MAGN|nr:hypothetical protein GIB67_022412 [Kingdonia uniflora]
MLSENKKNIRKPKPWKHFEALTRTQLNKMRDEFWDTAPHYGGQKEIWDALRAAAENDVTLAQAFIDSAGIIVASTDLTTCYDERGAKYELPKYVLNSKGNGTKRSSERRKIRDITVSLKTSKESERNRFGVAPASEIDHEGVFRRVLAEGDMDDQLSDVRVENGLDEVGFPGTTTRPNKIRYFSDLSGLWYGTSWSPESDARDPGPHPKIHAFSASDVPCELRPDVISGINDTFPNPGVSRGTIGEGAESMGGVTIRGLVCSGGGNKGINPPRGGEENGEVDVVVPGQPEATTMRLSCVDHMGVRETQAG